MYNNLICFLTIRPSNLFYDFVLSLPNPENIYICIDDNYYKIPDYDYKIKIIKFQNRLCEREGFKNTHSQIKGATSREKALYYFCKNNIDFDNVWFIEEDVFIPTKEAIQNIDNKHIEGDLLVSKNDITYTKRTDWLWNLINKQVRIPPPYSKSMICAIRCSKKLLQCIHNYAKKYKTLFMCEALFNTICIHNNLKLIVVEELSTITWNYKWKHGEVNKTNLFHPVKSISQQYKFRTPYDPDSDITVGVDNTINDIKVYSGREKNNKPTKKIIFTKNFRRFNFL
jgi:hypothetical protein